MKHIALLAVAAVALASPATAKSHHRHHLHHPEAADHRGDGEHAASAHAAITCDMVRAYVAQVGLTQAKALAQSEGMTASEERRAMRCLDKKI